MYKRVNDGFTLVELLIVIGIISLLIALIVPALGRAREQSKLVVCRSNQRNLLLGCLMYAGENKSRLPVDKQLHNTHAGLIENLTLGKYILEPKVYYCPSERREDLKYSEENFEEGNIPYFYYSYSKRATLGILSKFFLKMGDLLESTMFAAHSTYYSTMNIGDGYENA